MNDEFWLQRGNYSSNLYYNLLQLLTLFIGFKMYLEGNIGDKMPLMIVINMNTDTDLVPQKGKEDDDVLDQEVGVEVEIGHVLRTEIKGDIVLEVEEGIDFKIIDFKFYIFLYYFITYYLFVFFFILFYYLSLFLLG